MGIESGAAVLAEVRAGAYIAGLSNFALPIRISLMIIALPTPELIEIRGEDAVAFANAQFCNELSTLAPLHWQFNAWLNPQGRVRVLFALLRRQDGSLLLQLRGGDAAAISADLARYRFRSKVELRTLGGWRALGLIGGAAIAAHSLAASLVATSASASVAEADGMLAITQPGETPRALLLQAPSAELSTALNNPASGDVNAWLLADIDAGLPLLNDATSSEFLPQSLGLEKFGALSFNKGCYPGQEIIARVHFKGGNKRHLYRVDFTADAAPAEGSEIRSTIDGAGSDPSTTVGVLLQVASHARGRYRGLAVLREDGIGETLLISGGVIGAWQKC